MKHELSTVGGELAAKSKKGEGKKRAFPLNPYREKAKPKEIKPGVNSTGLSRMRTHARRCGDPYATRRIFAACDYEQLRKKRKNKIDSAMRKLDAWDRAFAQAVLQGKSWQDMGIAKSTFSDSLKRIEKILRGL